MIPVTVLGGYLGAGKTTLLNHLLRNAGGRRIAVLVNDFGEIGIDADLIESHEADVLNLSGGCICCSFGSDLVGALRLLAERSPKPEHIVIEASGVALPEGIGQAVGLVRLLALDSIIVVVDAATVRRHAGDRYVGDLVTAQLAQADLVVVNKLDLVGGGSREDLDAWLRGHAPSARFLPASGGEVACDVILGPDDARSRTTSTALRVPFRSNRMRPDGQLRKPVAPAAEQFVSLGFRLSAAIDLGRLARDMADPRLGVLRAKGIARDCDGTTKAFHLAGARAEVRGLHRAQPDSGRLVFIGLRTGLDRAAVTACVQAAVQAAARG